MITVIAGVFGVIAGLVLLSHAWPFQGADWFDQAWEGAILAIGGLGLIGTGNYFRASLKGRRR